MKKFGWLGLLLALTLMVTACGGNNAGGDSGKNSQDGAASSDSADAPYEVVYAYPIFDSVPADIQLVQDEINKIAKEKINVTVKLLPISNSAFANQINLMMTSGEKLDMIAMLGNYSTQVGKGVLYPIGNIMEEHAQGIIDVLGDDYYNATKIGGVSYGVPSIRDLAQDYGFVMRKDLVDKHNIDLSEIQTFDDFEKIFKIIKDNEPGMVGAANLSNGSILSTYNIHDPLGK